MHDLDPWTASWTGTGDVSSFLDMFSCCTNVLEIKSPRDPESISARAGCPLIVTTTTSGLGTCQAGSRVCVAFRWIDG